MHFPFFSVCCVVAGCSWERRFDKKQKSCIKRIHLLPVDGLYYRNTLYKIKVTETWQKISAKQIVGEITESDIGRL